MVVPLMLRGDYCIRKDLRSPYIVSLPSRLPGGKEALENIFFHVQENSCQSAAAVHNNSRSYQTMCARGGIGRRARFRF